MKKILRLLSIPLALLTLTLSSPAMDNYLHEEDTSFSLTSDTLNTIKSQQEGYRSHELHLALLARETESYDEVVTLALKDNIYHVPEVKSTCGFLLGRCAFYTYPGSHPNHDCVQVDSGEMCEGVFSVAILVNSMGAIPSIFSNNYIYSIVAASISGWSCLKNIPGYMLPLLITPLCFGQEFRDSFDRGQLCLPEDRFSCTSCTGSPHIRPRYEDIGKWNANRLLGILCCNAWCYDSHSLTDKNN